MLKVTNLSKNLKKQLIIDDLSFAIKEGEIFCVFGHNASGKSTLANILCGSLLPDKGEVLLYDKNIFKTPGIRKYISIAYQSINIPQGFTPLKFLQFYGKIVKGIHDKKTILEFSRNLGIKEKDMYKDNSNLSGGTRKKIEFLKTLINENAKFYIFDEPTIGFDPPSKKFVWQYIKELKNKNKIVFLITNIEEERDKLADSWKTIINGKLIQKEVIKMIKLKITVKNWKKEIKKILEELEGVEEVKVKINEDNLVKNLGLDGAKNVQVIDLSDKGLDVDSVLEKLGIDKNKESSVSVLENTDSEYIIIISVKNEDTIDKILKIFMENEMKIVKFEKE